MVKATGVKQGWKVLRGKSSYVANTDPDRAIFYRVNRWVVPKSQHGPLCVFSSLKAAKGFAEHRWGCQVYTCDYIPSQEMKIWAPSIYPGGGSETRSLGTLPSGTRLAAAVMIRKPVK